MISASTTSLLQSSSDQAPIKNLKGKPRLFGDTLTKNSTPNRGSSQQQQQQQQFTPTHPIKSREPLVKSSISKIVPPPAVTSNNAVNNNNNNNINNTRPSRINPISYFRRERTFDMSLTQTQNAEKFKPKFSPQFQRKTTATPPMTNLPRMEVIHTSQKTSEIRQMTTQERYRANLANRNSAFQSEISSATKQRSTSKNDEKMQTIDKKIANKNNKKVENKNFVEKTIVTAKKSSDNSAISNPTMSTSSFFKYTKTKQETTIPFETSVAAIATKETEIINYTQQHLETESKDHQQGVNDGPNNFYYGMQEASVDTDENDDDEIADETTNQAQMDAINKFAEDIFKMSGSGSKSQGE